MLDKITKQKDQSEDKENLFAFQSIKCEYCEGSGRYKEKDCHNCRGKGIVFWFDQNIFYWGKKISTVSILENRLEKTARTIVNSVLFLFGVGGFLYLFYYIWDNGYQRITTVNFWLEQSWAMLIFWFSLITDMYLLYRFDKESSLAQKVKKRKYGKTRLC